MLPDIQILSQLESKEYINIAPRELTQIVIQILQNAYEAVKFAKIKVRTHQENNYCNLEIQDNGPGINIFPVKKIFLPFFSTKSEHLGLGLYLCKILIEKNAGSIEAGSREDSGAWFKIRFPLPDK